MPGSEVRYARASASVMSRSRDRSYAPSRSYSSRRIAWMRGAFVLARPPERIASARAVSGAATTCPHVGNAVRSDVNARSAFTSLVCWLKTVRISTWRGSVARGGDSWPKRRSSRRRIARTRRGVAFGSAIAPDGTERGLLGLTARRVPELRQRRLEAEPYGARRPVPVLREDQLGLALLLVIGVVAVDEHDDVAVLFERSRFPEIGKLRPLVCARLRVPVQLRQRQDRDLKLLREELQGA